MGVCLESRNISRNGLHRVLQRHEILDRSTGAVEKERDGEGVGVRVRQKAPQKDVQMQVFRRQAVNAYAAAGTKRIHELLGSARTGPFTPQSVRAAVPVATS
jgi:hypothetical protein